MDTKNACFSDLYTQVDDLVKKLYQLFVMVQSQNLKIKTFEDTMVQLDDVFTNSANGENEMANLEVAAEIRKMQQVQLDNIFELQNELSHLKAVKDVPQDLAQLLRRAVSNIKPNKLTCIDGDSEPPSRQANHNDGPPQRQGSNRRGGARSKSRSKKPPTQDNKRIDKTAKALGIEINSTLDRISELDAQNELLMLENQKLKEEMVEMQGKQKET